MIKKKKSVYLVYNIIHNGKVVYVGRTTDLRVRERRHNLDYRKGLNKELYNYLRDEGVETIKLNLIVEYKEKVQSKRFEMYLMLINYFENDMKLTLKQRIPNISDLAR
jgi:hypothetical protein